MSRTTQILAVLFILVAAFFLWNMFATDPEVANLSAEPGVAAGAAGSVDDARTIETLLTMRNLRLDGRLFESAAFRALVNTERQIVPEPVGRPNPFLPIGSDIQGEGTESVGEQVVSPARQQTQQRVPVPPAPNPQDDELFEE